MYPYLMDSDHVSLIDRAGLEGARILARILTLFGLSAPKRI